MYMQLSVNRVDPKSGAAIGQGNLGGTIDDDDIRRLGIVKQLPDMDMAVTLRAALLAVNGKAPRIAK